jgi:hypothetical protein
VAVALAVVLAGLGGCLLTPERFSAARAPFRDLDGDGVTEAEGDCAPTDPAVFPGAEEWCDGRDNNCSGEIDEDPVDSVFYVDADGDGYGDPAAPRAACVAPAGTVAAGTDCDDTAPTISPGALEACNDVDDDCDGIVDESAPPERLWYPDADGDGVGVGSVPVVQCAAPGPGYAPATGDCDDGDPAVLPGADERCDGVDNDCDGLVDEAPTVDPLEWGLDDDGDGHGGGTVVVVQCLDPGPPYVRGTDDCNDADPEIHPGADELCDGRDNDCDGAVDDPPTVGDDVWYADLDEDGYGDMAGSETSCEPGPGLIATGGDCDDSDPAVHPGAAEQCGDGIDNDCDGGPNHCVWDAVIALSDHRVVLGADGGRLGAGVAVADLDGDGRPEALGGEPGHGAGGRVCAWEAPLASAPTTAACDGELSGAAGAELGSGLGVGDVDGDGHDDLLMGAVGLSSSASGAGGAYLRFGPVSAGAVGASGDAILVHDGAGDGVGGVAAVVPDLGGDGLPDVVLAGPEAEDTLALQGAVFVHRQPASGSASVDGAARARIWGDAAGDRLGTGLAAGDIDGDGLGDLILGAPGALTAAGEVVVFYGPVRGSLDSGDRDLHLAGSRAGAGAGGTVAAPGDLNGDGYGELVLGAEGHSAGTERGRAHLFFGGAALASTGVGDADLVVEGDVAGEAVGCAVAGLGDLDGDGALDLGLASCAGSASSSTALVFLGPLSATGSLSAATDADIAVEASGARSSRLEVLVAGDATGDGLPDLLLGAPAGGTAHDGGVLGIVEGVGL